MESLPSTLFTWIMHAIHSARSKYKQVLKRNHKRRNSSHTPAHTHTHTHTHTHREESQRSRNRLWPLRCSAYPTDLFWLPTFITCSISRTLFVTNDDRSCKNQKQWNNQARSKNTQQRQALKRVVYNGMPVKTTSQSCLKRLKINKQLDIDLSVNNGLAKAWRLHWLTFHMVRIQGSVLAQSNYKLNAGWHLPLLPWETWTEHLVSPLTEGKNNLATGWFWLRYKRSLGSWKSKKSWGSSLSYPGKIKR